MKALSAFNLKMEFTNLFILCYSNGELVFVKQIVVGDFNVENCVDLIEEIITLSSMFNIKFMFDYEGFDVECIENILETMGWRVEN